MSREKAKAPNFIFNYTCRSGRNPNFRSTNIIPATYSQLEAYKRVRSNQNISPNNYPTKSSRSN